MRLSVPKHVASWQSFEQSVDMLNLCHAIVPGVRRRQAVAASALPAAANAATVLGCVHIACVEGGIATSGRDCLACRRFIGCAHDGAVVTLSCVWYGFDPVSSLMWLPPALTLVAAHTGIAEVVRMLPAAGARQVLVVCADELVGVIGEHEVRRLPDLGATAGDLCARSMEVTRPDAQAHQAIWQMRELDLESLPVVEGRTDCSA